MDPNILKSGSDAFIKKEITSPIKKELTPAPTSAKEIKMPTTRLGGASRLPSFKGPRDLTLSALVTSNTPSQVTRTKKIFQPNIPVRREKGERVMESKSESGTRKNLNKSKSGDFVKGRGRGKEKAFVQMKGSLFGEGTAAAPLKRSSDIHRGGGEGKGGGGSKIGEMQKPVLNPDAAYNIDKDLEEKKLKEILRDDFIDDPHEVMAIDILPVHLPMINKNETSLKLENLDIKTRHTSPFFTDNTSKASAVKVKQEPGTEDDFKTPSDKKVGLIDNSSLEQDQELEGASVADILSKTSSDLMFLQLPSCLPGHPPEIKLEPSSVSESTNSSRDNTSNKDGSGRTESTQPSKQPLCSLESLPEGQIGSLKIFESGRVHLCLGNHTMEMSRGTQVGFLQDVVRIEVDSELKTGSLVVLGHIQDRLVCTPDFHNLTKNLNS